MLIINNMNILIVTTKDYHLFYQNGDWNKSDCENVLSYITQHNKKYNGDAIEIARDFYGKEKRMRKFWTLERPRPIIKLLHRTFMESEVFIMPCIPKYHIELMSDYDDAFQLNLLSRQDYLAAIIQDVLTQYNRNDDNIYLVVHDRDIFNEEADRRAYMSDINKGSKLYDYVDKKIVSVDKIYGFQHVEDSSDIYNCIEKLLNNDDFDIISKISIAINNSSIEELGMSYY